MPMGYKQSILSAEQFDRAVLDDLINLTRKIEQRLKLQKNIPLLKDNILASLFFEASTRTRLSFETAMIKLGGKVITSVGFQFSSISKGETLYDTLKMIEAYADVCVIRHPKEGVSELAAKNISIPVINAGDGIGEHPTQALLDLYTIDHSKNICSHRLKIAFMGDIKYGRTIHSLYKLLLHYNIEFVFVSPSELKLPKADRIKLQQTGITFDETEDIKKIYDADVIYITRIQQERFADQQEYEEYAGYYIFDKSVLDRCKRDVIIMHPLPRVKELSTDIDSTNNAVYFNQAQYGVYMRMALLLSVMGKSL